MTPLDIAVLELGVTEDTGENDGVPSSRYMGGKQEPWCAHFVCWVYARAGRPIPGSIPSRAKAPGKPERWNPYANVQVFEDAMRARGFCLSSNAIPAPGDVVFFASRGHSDPGRGRHCAILERYDPPFITTIDGNWQNAVRRVHRSLTAIPSVTGYARPPSRTAA